MGVGAQDLALIGIMIVAKLSSSVDDFVWLLPFVSKNNKVCFAYVFIMMFVSTCAIALSYAGDVFLSEMTDEEQYWNAERTRFFLRAKSNPPSCFGFLSCLFFFHGESFFLVVVVVPQNFSSNQKPVSKENLVVLYENQKKRQKTSTFP